ncbi:RraA family protein [Pseudahrensia aquimaris]|uniref:RraA family protein n=1 Tax=Pseudahrensia aquimaris TaxID=744461 RepID=A0ABW3FE69_9HYPH
MTDPILSEVEIDLLARCDTPTVCNAIEVAQGKRGFESFTRQQMVWSDPSRRSVVGYARTAKIAGANPPTQSAEVLRARRKNYFRHMASGPRPGIAVVEDTDGDAARGAWWGEVHAYVHMNVCNLSGALTNGLLRDMDDMPEGFPILAGSLGPSHGFVHVVETGTPVTINGLSVKDGDLVHADCHGAVVIPTDVQPKLKRAIKTLFDSEAIVLDPLKRGKISLEEFEALWARFEAART